MSDYPSHVDWRTSGVVSNVKDQGRCGSCWSFGSAETVESHFALKHGFLPVLSEQQILDCTPNPAQCGGTGGCGGGTAELAYARLAERKQPLLSEWQYPYRSYFGDNFFSDTCAGRHNVTGPHQASVVGYTKLTVNSPHALLAAVATKGPIAISVDANAWKAYKGGVFDGCNKASPDIDHNVQLVGYGTDKATGLDYWIVRNSWAPTWGEDGFIRLRRYTSGDTTVPCALDVTPLDGSGCKNGPSAVEVCGNCGIAFDTVIPHVA
jgi:cathepsin L